MNELQCYNCGHTSSDPGGVLDTYECSQCGQRTLIRPVAPHIDRIGHSFTGALAGGLIGCALGAAIIGFQGMFIGAMVGAVVGWIL